MGKYDDLLSAVAPAQPIFAPGTTVPQTFVDEAAQTMASEPPRSKYADLLDAAGSLPAPDLPPDTGGAGLPPQYRDTIPIGPAPIANTAPPVIAPQSQVNNPRQEEIRPASFLDSIHLLRSKLADKLGEIASLGASKNPTPPAFTPEQLKAVAASLPGAKQPTGAEKGITDAIAEQLSGLTSPDTLKQVAASPVTIPAFVLERLVGSPEQIGRVSDAIKSGDKTKLAKTVSTELAGDVMAAAAAGGLGKLGGKATEGAKIAPEAPQNAPEPASRVEVEPPHESPELGPVPQQGEPNAIGQSIAQAIPENLSYEQGVTVNGRKFRRQDGFWIGEGDPNFMGGSEIRVTSPQFSNQIDKEYASSITSPESLPERPLRAQLGEGPSLRPEGEAADVRAPAGEAPEPAPRPGADVPGNADEPFTSRIANRFSQERSAQGEIGEIEPGQGYSTIDLVNRGLRMSPEEVAQHVSDVVNGAGGDPKLQAAAVRAEEARLSQRSADLSRAAEANPRDLAAKQAADDAFKDLTDFHNGPVAKLKNNWHAQGMALQGEIPVDLSTFNGMREQWLRDVGKAPTPKEEPMLRQQARRVANVTEAERTALDRLGREVERATSNRKLPSPESVRDSIIERMKNMPCRV